jgi:hypothetical protein
MGSLQEGNTIFLMETRAQLAAYLSVRKMSWINAVVGNEAHFQHSNILGGFEIIKRQTGNV